MRNTSFLLFIICLTTTFSFAQEPNQRCTNNPARSWWDVRKYDLNLTVDTGSGNLKGAVQITAKVLGKIGDSLQIDLQEPLHINFVTVENPKGGTDTLKYQKQGNHYFVKGDFPSITNKGLFSLTIGYEGIPPIAANPPWDGGIVMKRDEGGLPWMGMVCQGNGASIWFPCKDFEGDEADDGMLLSMVIPANLQMISNGRLQPNNERRGDGKLRWTWKVVNPINNYDITFYIGDYVHWSDTFQGVNGVLSLDYFVLRNNEEKAKEQFKAVKPMLQCFEEKLGAYPFYEDGYKLVDAPYLGMEHQSAVAYGNKYKMGYEGEDRSYTGIGLLFDFIIVHESGHEWFGNSITAYDKADTWIHEGFTTYTETIFAECLLGKDSAFLYQQGKVNLIQNDKPVEGHFNECDEGSSDHYDKAAFMIHMIRMIMNDDTAFFGMLRAMNQTYYHKIVTGKEIEQFINRYSGKNFNKVFEQYLRMASIPRLEFKYEHKTLFYKWSNCVAGFDMPVLVSQNNKTFWLKPSMRWQKSTLKDDDVYVDNNFLIKRE